MAVVIINNVTMLSIADTFRLKTYLRPSLLYPSEDWAAVEVFVKSRGLRKEWLNKLYLTYTRLDESEPHRSGVVSSHHAS